MLQVHRMYVEQKYHFIGTFYYKSEIKTTQSISETYYVFAHKINNFKRMSDHFLFQQVRKLSQHGVY